jgi:hypothetical protein
MATNVKTTLSDEQEMICEQLQCILSLDFHSGMDIDFWF